MLVLDLRGLSDIADYFLICHGGSDRHVQAIATNIEAHLNKNFRLRPASVEGQVNSEWVLIDYIDFIVHVFLGERRKFYRLERLWGDAPLIDIPQPVADIADPTDETSR